MWIKTSEGPFETESEAREFAEAECGMEWEVRQGTDGLWFIWVNDPDLA